MHCVAQLKKDRKACWEGIAVCVVTGNHQLDHSGIINFPGAI
jgi:hypothetical protein